MSTPAMGSYGFAFVAIRLLAVITLVQFFNFGFQILSIGTYDSASGVRGVILIMAAASMAGAAALWAGADWLAKCMTPKVEADRAPDVVVIEAWQSLGFRLLGLYIAYAGLMGLVTFLSALALEASAYQQITAGVRVLIHILLALGLIVWPHHLSKLLPGLGSVSGKPKTAEQ